MDSVQELLDAYGEGELANWKHNSDTKILPYRHAKPEYLMISYSVQYHVTGRPRALVVNDT
jgi:hypothetical protein